MEHDVVFATIVELSCEEFHKGSQQLKNFTKALSTTKEFEKGSRELCDHVAMASSLKGYSDARSSVSMLVRPCSHAMTNGSKSERLL